MNAAGSDRYCRRASARCFGISRPQQPSGDSVLDHFPRPADIRGDDRHAQVRGFEHDVRQALGEAALHDDVDRRVQRGHVADVAQELHAVGDRRAISASSRSLASNGPTPANTSCRPGNSAASDATALSSMSCPFSADRRPTFSSRTMPAGSGARLARSRTSLTVRLGHQGVVKHSYSRVRHPPRGQAPAAWHGTPG